ncbi:MAG: 4Fe-4S dicluster domain-containing protein [Mariniblastus sp.]
MTSDSNPPIDSANTPAEITNDKPNGASGSGPDRRDFLKKSAALTVIGTTAAAAQSHAASPTTDEENELFQPKEYWEDRMQDPDDSKKLGWFVDTRRCFGCHGCEVSCKSENDVPLGNYIRQTFYHDEGEYPKVARLFLPMSCQHCEDAPCIKACPCGALHKEAGGTVAVDYETCCGHGTCVDVCPYGAIYMDPVAKQAVKCHNCYHRADHGLEPACVPTCPSEALYFGDLNDENSKISKAMKTAEAESGLVQLRSEKETKPRMWFAGDAPAKIEPRIPEEGESYNPEAYNIYNWKPSKADADSKDETAKPSE